MSKMKQGGIANANGHTLEGAMIPMFEHRGFEIIQYADIKKDPSIVTGKERYVVRNAPFTTIYDSNGKTEFVMP